jgi:hypothetical protein
MWQMFLWVAAISIAFAIWGSLSRANEKMEASQRVVPVRIKRPRAGWIAQGPESPADRTADR